MSDTEAKYFVRAFIRFLHKQVVDRKFSADTAESLEVAIQCLENVYEEEGTNKDTDNNPLNHIDLYETYRNAFLNVTADRKEEAEQLKNEGNQLMKDEKYSEALVMYNRAITIDASNPVFYCNRAAAYSRLGDYQKAVDDCKMSLRFDPNYGKAYGRLGLAYSKLNRFQQALEAYENAVRIEPDNTDYQTNMRITQQKFDEAKTAPNLAATVGGAAGGVPGGLPNLDFAAALNNPALVSMASRMMTDPSIQSMLSQLSGMNNVDALIETGRQLAMQMNTQNPDLFATMRQQMGMNADGQPDPNNQNDSNQDPKPEPAP